MTDNRSATAQLIAKMTKTPRPTVDNQGKPVNSYVYEYDETGRLITTKPSD
jgi:hypothetical protein